MSTSKFFKGLKISKDIYAQFFNKPSSDSFPYIELDVFQNGGRISVYRNPKCAKRDCFYSDVQLTQILENDANESPKYEFVCQICSQRIILNAFVNDSVMQLALEQANKMNGKYSMKIMILKDGSWKPHPDYSSNLLNTMSPLTLAQESLPDIQNFSLQDFKRLMQLYTNEWSKDHDFTDIAIDSLGITVKFSDIYSVAFNSEITIDLMRFLMMYFESENQKSTSRWKIQYVGISVTSFDEVKSEGIFEYINGFEQTLGFNEFNGKDVIAIFYVFEKMWTLVLYRVQEKQVIALNYFHLAQSQMLTKFLLATVLGLRNPTLKLNPAFEIEKITELPSSGNIIFFFFHDLILDKNFTRMISAQKEGVKMIRTQSESLKWVVLKATENYLPPRAQSKRSIQKSTSIKQQSQRLVSNHDTEPSRIVSAASVASQRQPSPKIQPYNSTSHSIQAPKSQSSIRTARITQVEPEPRRKKTPPSPQRPQFVPRLSVSPIVSQQKYYQKDNPRRSMPKNEPVNEDMVQLSKEELMGLLEKVRENVLYEVSNPKEDLALKYADEIDRFNVRTSKIDPKMPLTLQNQSILMTGSEMYNILDRFKDDIRQEVVQDMKKGINYIDPQIEKEEAEKNFQGFQQILWYYYQYYPDMYKQLIDEYNHRFHNQLLEKMGLKEQFSAHKMQPQLQPRESQVQFHRQSMMPNMSGSSNFPQAMQRNSQRASQPNNLYRNSIANYNANDSGTQRSSFMGSSDGQYNQQSKQRGSIVDYQNSYRNSIQNGSYRNSQQLGMNNSNQNNGSRMSGFNSNNSQSGMQNRPDEQYKYQSRKSGGY